MKAIKFFLLAVFILVAVLVLLGSSDFDPDRYWVLAGGERVHFTREEHPGMDYVRDDIKVLNVEYVDGNKERYTFGETHAGYNSVELWGSLDHSEVVLIDRIGDEVLLGIGLDVEKQKVVYTESDFCSDPSEYCYYHYDHVSTILEDKVMIAPSDR